MSNIATLSEQRLKDQSTWIVIDQSALLHNFQAVRAKTLPSASVLAVIKANAYGHGLVAIAKALGDQVSYFGVSTPEEVEALRFSGIDTPILLLGIHYKDALACALKKDAAIAISSFEQAKKTSQMAMDLNKSAVIHIKVDTGMGRLGIPAREAVQEIERISKLEGLQLEGLFTHFPQGTNEGDEFTITQVKSFQKIQDDLAKKNIAFAFAHAANSVGTINFREAHFNMVRPGILLYGIYPDKSLKQKISLRPVLSWRAKVILIKTIKAGESVGYGREFQAAKDTVVGILPIGYGHGYPYALSGKAEVLFRGRRFPVLGRVSMDYIAVDFSEAKPGVQTGDTVTLLGRDEESEITAEELAETAGTIPYEIVTRLGISIPRFVL